MPEDAATMTTTWHVLEADHRLLGQQFGGAAVAATHPPARTGAPRLAPTRSMAPAIGIAGADSEGTETLARGVAVQAVPNRPSCC